VSDLPLAYIPDHEERAIGLIPSHLGGALRIGSLVGGIGRSVQGFEDEAFGLYTGSTLDGSVGAALDQWGALVGEDREGADDADYRRFIRARILAGRSTGTRDDLLRVWALVTGGAARIVDCPPALFFLWTVRATWMTDTLARRCARFVADLKPAGVAMVLLEAVSGYQGFSGDAESGVLGTALLARRLTEDL
jgi:hypothetical protein